jgi:hypothetical protein
MPQRGADAGGCPIKAGNMVLLSFPAANRDPAVFPDADKVIIDRKENRHSAFGLGIHRCVGSNLARLEMTVAVEEWLKRIPRFTLAGGVRGRKAPCAARASCRSSSRRRRVTAIGGRDLQVAARGSLPARWSFDSGTLRRSPIFPSANACASAREAARDFSRWTW